MASCNVAPKHEWKRAAPFAPLSRLEHLANTDRRDALIRHLNPNKRLAGNRRFDTNGMRREREREVVMQRRNF